MTKTHGLGSPTHEIYRKPHGNAILAICACERLAAVRDGHFTRHTSFPTDNYVIAKLIWTERD